MSNRQTLVSPGPEDGDAPSPGSGDAAAGPSQTPFETEVARLVVETLNLEDVRPEDIAPEEGLFDGELALDSVDALELALAMSQHYGVQLKAEDPNTREAFTTLRSLAGFVASHRPLAGDDAAAR